MATKKMHETLIRNFAKGAQFYQEEAYVQKRSAMHLITHLQALKDQILPGPILEIGCGTGFITESLLQFFPGRSICISDVSAAMVDFCHKRMMSMQGPLPNASFMVLDGEQQGQGSEYACIVSGMTMQWFQNFSKGLKSLVDRLKPEGVLLFSFLNDDSFPEWRSIAKELSLTYTGIPLPRAAPIDSVAKSMNCQVRTWNESIKTEYPNPLLFFKHLKRIGASTSFQQQPSSSMRKMLQHWENKCPQGISVTYNLTYGIITKGK